MEIIFATPFKDLPAAIAEGPHPLPSRTRKLSPPAPMVLGRGRPGRVGRRRLFLFMPIPLFKIFFAASIIVLAGPLPARSRALLARPEISVLGADNLVISYESFSRLSTFINIEEDINFESFIITLSRRTADGVEYAFSGGAGYAYFENYLDSEGNQIGRLENSKPGYIFSGEISRDIGGDLVIMPQWRVYLRGNIGFYELDRADKDKLDKSIKLTSSSIETALLCALQLYPLTFYGAAKFSYINDSYKYSRGGRSRSSNNALSILTPVLGFKYNVSQVISIRGESLYAPGFGESGYSGGLNIEF